MSTLDVTYVLWDGVADYNVISLGGADSNTNDVAAVEITVIDGGALALEWLPATVKPALPALPAGTRIEGRISKILAVGSTAREFLIARKDA